MGHTIGLAKCYLEILTFPQKLWLILRNCSWWIGLWVSMWSIVHLSIWLSWVVEQTEKGKGVAWANSTGVQDAKKKKHERKLLQCCSLRTYFIWFNRSCHAMLARGPNTFDANLKKHAHVLRCALCKLKLSNWWHRKKRTKSLQSHWTKNIGFHLIDQLVYMSGIYKCIHITSVWRGTTFFQTIFFGKEKRHSP